MVQLGGGGAQLQPDLVGQIDQAVATAKPNTGYGMTETCGIITAISGDFFVDRPESCGPVMPNFELRIIDDEGNPLAPGQVGELTVRGAPVIRGYLSREDATAETIVDGFLRTGDVARVDEDGFVYIVDRKKDMVLGAVKTFIARRWNRRSTRWMASPNALSSVSRTIGSVRKWVRSLF